MAEENKEEVVEEITEQASTQGKTDTTEKMFTQAELDDIVQKRLSKAEKAFEKKVQERVNEAEKLRKMNAEQKAEYEANKQAAYIAELEEKINRSGLEKEATRLLAESGIAVTAELLEFVVRTTAEDTLEAVENFKVLVDEMANAKVQEVLKGKTPARVEHRAVGDITKEQFARMGYKDRNELIQRDPELYNQLKG